MHALSFFLALDLDRERRAEAGHRSLERRVRAARAARGFGVRRQLAVALAAISRSSAGAVRRLDDCLADELVGKLASSR